MKSPTIEELKSVIALQGLPDEHLQWILDHSGINEFKDGEQVLKYGDPIEEMWIILEGSLDYYRNVNGREVFFLNFKNDTQSGGITGALPFSRIKTANGSGYAVGKVRGLTLHKKYFAELEQLNPDLIQRLISFMTERARFFATTQLQHEKVNALGKLAAGIAHELNNPAAAISRISSELIRRLHQNYILTERLLDSHIQAGHIQKIRAFIETLEKEPGKIKTTALQRMESEDEINNWLEQNNIRGKGSLSETFTEAGLTAADLETILDGIDKDASVNVLDWMENLLDSQRVVKDLGEASDRISRLVGAVKSHVQMDRTNEMEPTDIHKDIENTLTLLGYKLRKKNIKIHRKFDDNFPEVPAYIGELNQVWTNIIDNAIYAMDQHGELIIETCFDEKNANIKIIDNGNGIPEEIVSQIFDPFFTTKKTGEGTGIGLDLVKRIISHHNGTIKVDSRPGRTLFDICIPLSHLNNTHK